MQCSARKFGLFCQQISRKWVSERTKLYKCRKSRHVCGPAHGFIHHRRFSLSSIPSILVPPVVFGGLLITLWTYKCLMMIVFQNKIIYMPSVPPFSRGEKVAEYATQCRPVEWTEHSIKSKDGTKIKLLEGGIPMAGTAKPRKHALIVYFQGNASSLPPRLPYLSSILKTLQANETIQTPDVRYTLLGVSYRGFWASSGSANQAGIELDAMAALEWASHQFPDSEVVLWGQSIGAGVATVSLANLIKQSQSTESKILNQISGLLLETPFTSLRAMLVALYPQKFLPYRYLTPFLQSTWDSEAAFHTITEAMKRQEAAHSSLASSEQIRKPLKVMMLQAENDEIVPSENSEEFEKIIHRQQDDNMIEVERKVIRGALHTEVMVKPEGRKWIVQFLKSVGKS